MNSCRVCIVLPAYNEELTIRRTIEDFHSALPDASIIVIDNNSKDRTFSIANETLGTLACGKVIFEGRQGKGNAVRRAFSDVDADVYLMSDADCTYPASQAMDLLSPIVAGEADVVVGDRLTGGVYEHENKRPMHNFGNRLVRWLVNKLFSSSLVDVMSGYRAFSKEFVKNYPILVGGFQIETDLTLHALNYRYRMLEVPVAYQDRPAGSTSKLNTFSDGMRVLSTIAQILRYYRPLIFWGTVSALFGALGLVAGAPVIIEWVATESVKHVPLAILATGLEVIAMVSLAIGLILDSLGHFVKSEYEHRRLIWSSLQR